jgi:hypothetical protein
MTEFKAWLDDLAPKLPPKVLPAKAVHYALEQWEKLGVYLTDPIVPLDNNRCENAGTGSSVIPGPAHVYTPWWRQHEQTKGNRMLRPS